MSTVGKASIGMKKVDKRTDRQIALGHKKLVFAHKFASAGLTEIDLMSLTVPTEMSSLGFQNPSSAELADAKMMFLRANLRLVSSVNGLLIDYIAYDVISNTKIRLKSSFVSALNEIIVGVLEPVNFTGMIGVDAYAITQTGVVSGTDIMVGEPFVLNKNSAQQVGDVLLFIDGLLQIRNVGNSVSGIGNYYEVPPSAGGLSNVLRLNSPPVSPVNYAVVSNGLMAERPTAGVLAKIESLSAAVDIMIDDLALVTGNPTSKYQAAPSNVDLKMFGQRVAGYISGGLYDAVVGSSDQVDAGLATHTSIQSAHDAVAVGGKILILQGTYTGSVSLSKKVMLEGKGHGSTINGTVTISADYCLVRALRFADNVTISSGADANFIRECWIATTKTVTDNGTGNSWSGHVITE